MPSRLTRRTAELAGPDRRARRGQHGLLRQQITTAAVPSGSAPVLQAGGAPDQVDPQVNYTGANTLPAGTGWRWTGTLTAPANPGGTGLAAEGVRGQPGQLAAVRRRARDRAAAREHRRLPGRAGLVLRGPQPDGEVARPRRLKACSRRRTRRRSRRARCSTWTCASSRARRPAQIQLRWVPPDNQAASIAAAAVGGRRGQEGRDLRL